MYTSEDNPTGIYNLTKFTMLDFSGKLSCILWFAGCNMQCQYCHNKELVESKGYLSLDYLKEFLKDRVGKLEGVVLSGGEATLYKNLPELAKYIKSLGFQVKLDTNGTNPKMVSKLINEGLVDYIALDYKAPKDKFTEVTNCKLWDKFQATLDLLMENKQKVAFEVRTTWHTSLLSQEDVEKIAEDLNSKGYENTFYLQKCNMVDNSLAFAILPESDEIKSVKFTGLKVPVEFR